MGRCLILMLGNMQDEDVECPLCLDTLDISDLNFKPCSCGYQVCHFLGGYILPSLNSALPNIRSAVGRLLLVENSVCYTCQQTSFNRVLLASYKGEPKWAMSSLPKTIRRRSYRIQAYEA